MSQAEHGKDYDGHGNELSQAVYVAEGQSTSARSLAKVPVYARPLWPTPEVPNGGRGMPKTATTAGGTTTAGTRKVQVGLHNAVKAWPTPQAHDVTKGDAARVGRHGTLHGGRDLTDWVAKWPTPAQRDYRFPNNPDGASRSSRPPTSGEQLPNAIGGALSPDWVELLLGLPLGWTDVPVPKKRRK